jgi:hypothetical protein
MPEKGFQLLQLQGRDYPEHAPVVETAIRDEDMATGVETQKITGGLEGDDGAGDGITFRKGFLKIIFECSSMNLENSDKVVGRV